jgi:hypothetical protein
VTSKAKRTRRAVPDVPIAEIGGMEEGVSSVGRKSTPMTKRAFESAKEMAAKRAIRSQE